MRGQSGLYDNYIQPDQELKTQSKGRSSHLIIKRNKKLAVRYYYYAVIKRLNYVDAIGELTEEFDLANRTIIDLLQFNCDIIDELMKARPVLSKLKKEYPYLSW